MHPTSAGGGSSGVSLLPSSSPDSLRWWASETQAVLVGHHHLGHRSLSAGGLRSVREVLVKLTTRIWFYLAAFAGIVVLAVIALGKG